MADSNATPQPPRRLASAPALAPACAPAAGDLRNDPGAAGRPSAAPEQPSTPEQSIQAVVQLQLELANLHEEFIERQTALHLRVLGLLAPADRR